MKAFSPLLHYFKKERWFLLGGLVALVTVDLLQLVIPLIIKSAVDGLTRGSITRPDLLRLGLQLLGIGAASVVLRFCWRYCLIGTSRRIEAELRDRLFSHCLRIPAARLLRLKTGDLMARMTNDIDAVRMCTGIGIVAMLDTFVLGTASIAFMSGLSPRLTIVCLLPMLVIVLATWRLGGKLHDRFSQVQAGFSQLTEMVRETLAGIAVLRAYGRESDNARAFGAASLGYVDKNLALVKVWGLLFPFIMFIANVSVCLLIAFGGRLVIAGAITTGDFAAFASYIWILIWPMMALGWIVNLFQRGAASMARINDVLAIPVEDLRDTSMPPPDQPAPQLRLSGLSFSYEQAARPALRDITLAIPAGATVGITGTTGSGKSTLCSLLLRFYDPPRGTIFIDGTDILDMGLHELRSLFAYVPQDSFLFSDTIAANIAYGRPEAPASDIALHANHARMAAEIASFDKGLDTVIGEKGVTLSGGQKQRLCIARALLRQAPVLVCDDAMSALDSATAQCLIAELKAMPGSQTRLLISNRIASIQHAGIIHVLHDGGLAESGAHEQLIAAGGLYYQLYQRQRLEEAAAVVGNSNGGA